MWFDEKDLSQYKSRAVSELKKFCADNGFSSVIVGCSGGIDSALTIALAAAALGPKNVTAITMPSSVSSTGSVSDSQTLCDNLGVTLQVAPIQETVDAFSDLAMGPLCTVDDLALENLQARIRGMMLMTYSNKMGGLVLATGNRSEAMVGYATLYGDTCGGLNLIGDLFKEEVWALASYLNKEAGRELIPEIIIKKKPSAELYSGQTDQDSLPPYEVLDAILIQDQGGTAKQVAWANKTLGDYQDVYLAAQRQLVRNLVTKSEFKRKQAAPYVCMHQDGLSK